MLILTRGIGETLMIDDDKQVTVLGVRGCQVRLGVKAPDDCVIDREEIHLRKKSEAADIAKKTPKQPTINFAKRAPIRNPLAKSKTH